MPVQKLNTTLSNAITLTAGSGQTTSSVATTLLGWHKVVHIKLTNGATGPATAATAVIQISPDNVNWYNFQSGGQTTYTGSTANNGVASFIVLVWGATEYVRILWTAGDTQNVTATAVLAEMLEMAESTTDPSSNLVAPGESAYIAVRVSGVAGGCFGNMLGVSNTGNTSGNTGLSNVDWVVAGSNGITVSEATTAGGPNTLWIIDGQSTQSAIKGLGVSNTGNTAGNTGISTGIDWVFAGSNGITASESTNAGGPNTIWISGTTQSNQSAIKGLGVSNTGNTAGNTGLSTGINWVIAASNNITASESTAVGGPNTIWISGIAQSSQSAIKGLGVSNTGSTAGNTGLSTGIDWVFAGSNNITASESTVGGGPNTIWISGGAAQSNQSAIKGLGVSNTGNTAGNTGLSTGVDWVFAGSNNITASESTVGGGPNTIWISGAAQSNQSAIKGLGVSNTGSTAGNTGISTGIDWVIAGTANITASESTVGGGPNTIWISGAAQSNQSAIKGLGVSNTGSTAGNTGISTGIDWVIAGTNNITASESTVGGGPNTIWISGAAQSNQSAIKGLGVSNTGNTAGNTGISTGIDWVIAGSSNITVSESTVGGGPNTIWISKQTSQSAIKGLGVSNTGNTAGNTGLSTGVDWVIAGSGGITASESTVVGGQINIVISGNTQTSQSAIKGLGISNTGNTAGNTGISTGIDWVLAGTNNITLSQSTTGGGAHTIYITGPTLLSMGMSNLGNTAGSSAMVDRRMVFVGSNNISLSQSVDANSDSGTITIAPVFVSSYENLPTGIFVISTFLNSDSMTQSAAVAFQMQQPISISFLRFPILMTTNSTLIATSGTSANCSAEIYSTWNAVVYSLATGANSKSLSSVASSSAGFTQGNSISVAANGTQYSITQYYTYQVEGSQVTTSTGYSKSTSNYAFSTTNWHTLFSTQRWLDINFANSLTAGPYWLLVGGSTSTSVSGNVASLSQMTNCNVRYQCMYGNAMVLTQWGVFGSTDFSSGGGNLGYGLFTTAGGGTTNSLPLSAITNAFVVNLSCIRPYFLALRSV